MRRAATALLARAAAPLAAGPAAARAAATAAAGSDAPTTSGRTTTDETSPSSAPAPPPAAARHPQFTVVGRLAGRTPPAPSPVFAIVELGGAQVKVSPDDLVYTDRLPGVGVQDVLRLDRVLAVGSRSATRVGRPFLPDAAVTAAVEEVTLDAKVTHFHKRRRKASRRTTGHRQPLTALRVMSVEGVDP